MSTIILLAILAGVLYIVNRITQIYSSVGHERIILLIEVVGPHKIEAIGKRKCKPLYRGR